MVRKGNSMISPRTRANRTMCGFERPDVVKRLTALLDRIKGRDIAVRSSLSGEMR